MKSAYKQIGAFVFALLILGSTTSTAMSFHICGGAVTDTALFKEAKGCGMHHHTPKSDDPIVSKKACCFNDTVNLNNDITIVIEKQHNIEVPVFIAPKSVVIAYPSIVSDRYQRASFHNHSPPLREQALFKLFQVYRI